MLYNSPKTATQVVRYIQINCKMASESSGGTTAPRGTGRSILSRTKREKVSCTGVRLTCRACATSVSTNFSPGRSSISRIYIESTR